MINFIIREQSQTDETVILVEESTKVTENSCFQYPFSWFASLAIFISFDKFLLWHKLYKNPSVQEQTIKSMVYILFVQIIMPLSLYIHTHTHTHPHILLFRATQHMEVSRLGVKSELQLPAYTTATVTNTRFEPHLQPTSWLTATPDP